jgi:hypothetical protein
LFKLSVPPRGRNGVKRGSVLAATPRASSLTPGGDNYAFATTTITKEAPAKNGHWEWQACGRASRIHQGRVKRQARKPRWRLGSIDNFGELGGPLGLAVTCTAALAASGVVGKWTTTDSQGKPFTIWLYAVALLKKWRASDPCAQMSIMPAWSARIKETVPVVLRAPKPQLTWDSGWSDDDALAFFFPHGGQALVVPGPFGGDFFVRENGLNYARLIALSVRGWTRLSAWRRIPAAPG